MNPDQKLIVYGVAIFIVAAAVLYAAMLYIGDFSIEPEGEKPSLTVLRQQEVTRDIKEFKMIKRLKHRDIVLKRENFTYLSEYQKYVTPNNETVQSYLTDNAITDSRDAYDSAVNWTWVSDLTLHGKLEHWLLPAEFISDTPADPDNPVPVSMVSDCESQAYTLVSLLEALDIPKINVRVVIGEVEFEGQTGGHAWVQIYENEEWFELEATSGSYWDDDDDVLVENTGFSFDYFKDHPYPVKEYWAFFNDRYYYNPYTGVKSPDLPSHWFI